MPSELDKGCFSIVQLTFLFPCGLSATFRLSFMMQSKPRTRPDSFTQDISHRKESMGEWQTVLWTETTNSG